MAQNTVWLEPVPDLNSVYLSMHACKYSWRPRLMTVLSVYSASTYRGGPIVACVEVFSTQTIAFHGCKKHAAPVANRRGKAGQMCAWPAAARSPVQFQPHAARSRLETATTRWATGSAWIITSPSHHWRPSQRRRMPRIGALSELPSVDVLSPIMREALPWKL